MNSTGTDSQRAAPSRRRLPTWLVAVGPLVLLALVVAGIVALKPLERLRGEGFPPVEELTVTRTVLPEPGVIELHVVNGGPDPVTIAQVMVDEAYWSYIIDAGRGSTADPALEGLPPEQRRAELARRRTVPRLGRATVTLPYRWVRGEAHEVTLISSTGVTFSDEIEVAVESPALTAGYFGLFALIGVLVGLIPVYLGLAWYPLLQRLSEPAINVLLCFTVGLLAFLLIDAVVEAFEVTERLPETYNGPALIALGLFGSILALTAGGRWLEARARRHRAGQEPLVLAGMIALAIGLHNLGEGLAIGAAFNLGAISLGSMLIIGFTLHNITEGLAIVAPLARSGTTLGQLGWLGLLAGAPTIVGGWLGAFAYSPLWSVLFLAIGAGAVLQVIIEITRQMAHRTGWAELAVAPGKVGGLAAGFVVMYVTSLLVAA